MRQCGTQIQIGARQKIYLRPDLADAEEHGAVEAVLQDLRNGAAARNELTADLHEDGLREEVDVSVRFDRVEDEIRDHGFDGLHCGQNIGFGVFWREEEEAKKKTKKSDLKKNWGIQIISRVWAVLGMSKEEKLR
jgi:hypothetical protein